MKRIGRIFLCAMLFAYVFFAGKPLLSKAEDNKASAYDINEYANSMQPGWNLGNTFDGFDTGKIVLDETAWGNPRVTKELIDKIADEGFKSIRIPITFDTRLSDGPDYTINPEFLARIERVVNWALEANLKVMINIHHDSWRWIADGMVHDHDNTVAKFKAIWTQLADRFKDYNLDLMFESLNEPQFWGAPEDSQRYLNELNSLFYSIVRHSGGNNDIRPLVLPTLNTGSEPEKLDALYNFITQLNDPYIIATIHYYGFWPFSVNIAGVTNFNEETKNDIIHAFDRVHDKFIKNGIPVVIGEYGLLGFDRGTGTIQQGEKLKYFEFMIHYAQEKNLIHMLWDNGQHFGRTSFKWYDAEFGEMLKASWNGRSATADANFIYLKQGKPVQDVTRILQLNGRKFISLQLNGKDLVAGKDYEINGKSLTIKASLLSKLVSNKIREKAVLTATFDKGANWYFHIFNYDTPSLSDSTGTVSNFTIPIKFNGTHLKTMEAKYVDDGSNAGPQNWTSFKEFGYAFSPDYEHDVVTFPYGNERFFLKMAGK
uniref:GE40 n=1 Tax=Geobacillus thermodenitrificans TaxID=33940 RepID=A0A291I5R3_GEOTD|nr:GE40 [Geobacillus thermodenitrificans]